MKRWWALIDSRTRCDIVEKARQDLVSLIPMRALSGWSRLVWHDQDATRNGGEDKQHTDRRPCAGRSLGVRNAAGGGELSALSSY